MMKRNIYLIGSLGNPEIPVIGEELRKAGHEVFDDWFAPGPETDSYWKGYEELKGHSLVEALNGNAAVHNFQFDLSHLRDCDTAIMCLPCGRCGHLELGWAIGQGKEGHILMPGKPERWDLMYRFAHGIWENVPDLIEALKTGRRNVLR